ncbi:hypothetical protein LSH36_518g02016 [Paralvinella palmiformis]|uniref:Endonuclease/exonuclease/phosphatase domain-containing protein n=1 Tax=Paralvinella palmiformis TaxID=53620 RepID=A0AAD9J851_9ANNE|nr:hypothetical protein LSH36_518g02016 [Paralvinella palmiformis]
MGPQENNSLSLETNGASMPELQAETRHSIQRMSLEDGTGQHSQPEPRFQRPYPPPVTHGPRPSHRTTTDFQELPSVTHETTPVEYTTSIHSPNQPPRDKYGQCCGGHHGAYEPHLVNYEQSYRAHKDYPERPKERPGRCPKRRPTKNHRGDPTADCAGRSKNLQTDCSPHPPTKHYPELQTRPDESQQNLPTSQKTRIQDNPPNTDLGITSWNIRGFDARRNMLLSHIQDRHPDIIMLQETLTSTNKVPKLPGHHIYHKPKDPSATSVSQGMITAVRQGIPTPSEVRPQMTTLNTN